MNPLGLTKLYDHLAVWERIPLLLAAHARGDHSEHQRLFDASPLRTWQCPEHLLAEQALHVLALVYIAEQLNRGATYFFVRLQMSNGPRPDEWLPAAELAAYLFTANAV